MYTVCVGGVWAQIPQILLITLMKINIKENLFTFSTSKYPVNFDECAHLHDKIKGGVYYLLLNVLKGVHKKI